MNLKTARDINVRGKRVLVRVDFNVPLDSNTGAVADDTRIRAVLPTLSYLIDRGARLILCSHLGHPKDKEKGLSLAPIAERLSRFLGLPVKMAEDCTGPKVEESARALAEGQVMLLENLRFHPGEERNDPELVKALSRLAEVFVNDAFSMCHRTHASIVGITQYLPSVAGFLLEKELDTITQALDNPKRPFTAIIGGRKMSDKMGIIENILDKVDSLLLAGGMGPPFLKSLKCYMGKLTLEEGKCDLAHKLIDAASRKGVHLLLPIDVVVADKFDPRSKFKTVPITEVPPGWHVMDVGPRTIEVFLPKLRRSKTIIWNGPVGVFEFPQFQKGTRAIATALANLDTTTTTIVSGGSTTEAVEEMELTHKLTHVSIGGGATLRILQGESLPGVASLVARH
ncbi:MAG: phosphoglycerate kinase [Dehalococcoidales bacterium]|nr:phosphoglycerate kinase [Dehalococcoidales bacterium]